MPGDPSHCFLTGARLAVSPSRAERADLEISNGRLRPMPEPSAFGRAAGSGARVELNGYLILPGLINAHDHLEFNLFPRLGRGPYPNASAWARDVYTPDRPPVREHLSVPRELRLWWGGLKNLLSGATTVVHHNPYHPTFRAGFPVHVLERYGWAHSLTFGTDIAQARRSTEADAPFIIHLAEGTDEESSNEIFSLDREGLLDHRTVLVHGVGLTEAGHGLRRGRGAGLVWCPTSNQFTLGTTLDRGAIRLSDRIALGSDSALTAEGTLLDDIRYAHGVTGLPAEWVYEMVTAFPAELLNLRDGEGTLEAGAIADLIAVPWRDGETPAAALMRTDLAAIELVMVSGRPHLVSEGVATRWPEDRLQGLEWISLDGVSRLVRAPVRELLEETRRRLGSEIRLAGMSVS